MGTPIRNNNQNNFIPVGISYYPSSTTAAMNAFCGIWSIYPTSQLMFNCLSMTKAGSNLPAIMPFIVSVYFLVVKAKVLLHWVEPVPFTATTFQ